VCTWDASAPAECTPSGPRFSNTPARLRLPLELLDVRVQLRTETGLCGLDRESRSKGRCSARLLSPHRSCPDPAAAGSCWACWSTSPSRVVRAPNLWPCGPSWADAWDRASQRVDTTVCRGGKPYTKSVEDLLSTCKGEVGSGVATVGQFVKDPRSLEWGQSWPSEAPTCCQSSAAGFGATHVNRPSGSPGPVVTHHTAIAASPPPLARCGGPQGGQGKRARRSFPTQRTSRPP
jgi:hypothetical protein